MHSPFICIRHNPSLSALLCSEQAWRAVDRAYVDKTFNGKNWFKVRLWWNGVLWTSWNICPNEYYKRKQICDVKYDVLQCWSWNKEKHKSKFCAPVTALKCFQGVFMMDLNVENGMCDLIKLYKAKQAKLEILKK